MCWSENTGKKVTPPSIRGHESGGGGKRVVGAGCGEKQRGGT